MNVYNMTWMSIMNIFMNVYNVYNQQVVYLFVNMQSSIWNLNIYLKKLLQLYDKLLKNLFDFISWWE